MRQRLLVKVTWKVHTSLVTLFGQRQVVTRIAVAGRDLNQRPFAHILCNLCIPTPTIHSMIYTLWTTDRLWVRYLKQLDFYECKQLLETRLIEVNSLPRGHFDSLPYGWVNIGIHKIASYFSRDVQMFDQFTSRNRQFF